MILIGKGPSARALSRELGIPRAYIGTQGVFVRGPIRRFGDGRTRFGWVPYRLADTEPVVSWGADLSTNLWLRGERPIINRRIISDKRRQLDLFHDAGVPHPVFACARAGQIFTVHGGMRDGTWLARRRYHFGGHDILGPMDFDNLARHLLNGLRDYGVQVIAKTHEWRVHVFRNEVLRIARKIPGPQAEAEGLVVWNQENSHFQYDTDLADSTRRELESLGRRAVSTLGMDFGAVDIIRKGGRGSDEYYVLEVNSAPGIADNGNTLNAYVEAIRRWSGVPVQA